MRTLILTTLAMMLTACATAQPMRLEARPTSFPSEIFGCPPDPGAWSVTASDVEIAMNERSRMDAGQGCRSQLRTVCLLLKANNQINADGSCPLDPRKPASVGLGG